MNKKAYQIHWYQIKKETFELSNKTKMSGIERLFLLENSFFDNTLKTNSRPIQRTCSFIHYENLQRNSGKFRFCIHAEQNWLTKMTKIQLNGIMFFSGYLSSWSQCSLGHNNWIRFSQTNYKRGCCLPNSSMTNINRWKETERVIFVLSTFISIRNYLLVSCHRGKHYFYMDHPVQERPC